MNKPKIKVMFLITSLSMGGAERHVVLLAKELLKTNKYYPVITTFSSGGVFYQEARNAKIPVISLNRKNKYDFFTIYRLYKLLVKENVSILHSHMFFSNMVARFSGKLAGVQVIISTEHGISLWKNSWLILLDRFTQKLTDKIITVSNISRQVRLSREKIQEDRITTIHNFINIDEFNSSLSDASFNEQYNLRDKYVLGMITRLTKNKRVDDAIIAVSILTKEGFKNIRLLVLGDGPEKNNLQELSRKLKVTKQVIFTGFQPNIISWLSFIDVFLLISQMEDFPVSLLEAMAAANPVIATKVGGIPEIVKDKSSGILIDPGNIQALTKAIKWMINNKQKSIEMGMFGKKIIETNFSNHVIIPQITNLYEKLLYNRKLID